MRVSVIIPQHGQVHLTERLVAQLRRFASHDLQIVVVDDGSPDADPFPWPQDSRTLAIRQPHSGTTAAWNRGAVAADGEVLVFLNNDVEVEGPFVERLIAPLCDARAELTGVEWRHEDRLPVELGTGLPRRLLAGWCFALSRRQFELLQGFDPRFRLYYSDTDLQWRLIERSGPERLACVPDLPLRHLRHATTRRYPPRETLWRQDRARFVEKRRRRTHEASGRGPHLVQIGNAGRVTGGTGACAWTVTRALPDWRHTILFRSAVDSETRRAFAPAEVFAQGEWSWPTVGRFRPDLLLLHNISSPTDLLADMRVPCVNYLHSKVVPMRATKTVCCSQWLRSQLSAHGDVPVLYQGVPIPPRDGAVESARVLRDEPIVGRLCTPTGRKWPAELVEWYALLAEENPQVRWEFVGCPAGLEVPLQQSCRGRATFHPAGFDARRHLWRWDVLLYHHPTLTESFGRTVAEAMRAGCIPIIDDRGGFREQIADGTGFLCRTFTDFRDALQVVRDPGARRQRSRRCQSHGDEQFSLERFRRDLLGVFQAALRTGGAFAAFPASPSRRRSPGPAHW